MVSKFIHNLFSQKLLKIKNEVREAKNQFIDI